MAIQSALTRLRREPLPSISIFGDIEQLCKECHHLWRDRLLTPLVTLRLFLLQVLHGNTAITHLRQLASLNFAPASYCEARQRLPLELITGLLQRLAHFVNAQHDNNALPPAQRVLIVDGSSFSTADTPELRKHFGLYPGARPGVGYPMGRLLGLLDAASGMFVQLLALPLLVHDMSKAVMVHAMLQTGDILLGDRAFCSFVHFVLLQERGVFACCRLHQMRKSQGGSGTERWHKPSRPPAWMSLEQFAAMPESIQVRLVSYSVHHRGFRSRQLTVATTLLDERQWPDERIVALYGQRWEIETCFNHLKTTMKMNMLRCQTVAGVQKELAMYLLAYNLVRLVMLKTAASAKVPPGRISFIDAMRWLSVRLTGLNGTSQLIVNPVREGRWNTRVIRGRMKAYDMLVRPRETMQTAENEGKNA